MKVRRKKLGKIKWTSRLLVLWIGILSVLSMATLIPSCALFPKKSPQSYMDAGRKYYIKKDYAKSYKNYNKAIMLNPVLYEAYWERANVKISMDSLEQSLDDMTIYIDSGPTIILLERAYNQRANIMFKLGYKVDACADWISACELNQSNYPCEQFRLHCK